MNFEPKTEQQIIESKLWPKADYDFEIVDAFDKTSKTSGKPMIELKLRLSRTGSTRIISDYLLVETPEKLLHAATALGLLDKYQTGSLSGDDFRGGKRGKLKLAIEKDKKHVYPDKNVVSDYVCASQPLDVKTGGLLSFK